VMICRRSCTVNEGAVSGASANNRLSVDEKQLWRHPPVFGSRHPAAPEPGVLRSWPCSFGSSCTNRRSLDGALPLRVVCLTIIGRLSAYTEAGLAQDRSELLPGTLDMLVLQTLSVGSLHGYAIAQRLKQMSRNVVQVTQGTLYPALHRLENRGLMTADWKMSDTGREAKFYRLTRKGRAYLESEAASWERLTGAVAAILNAAKGEAS